VSTLVISAISIFKIGNIFSNKKMQLRFMVLSVSIPRFPSVTTFLEFQYPPIGARNSPNFHRRLIYSPTRRSTKITFAKQFGVKNSHISCLFGLIRNMVCEHCHTWKRPSENSLLVILIFHQAWPCKFSQD